MKKSIKKKTAGMVVLFLLIFTGMTIPFVQEIKKIYTSEQWRADLLALNEIQKLTEVNGISPAARQINQLKESIKEQEHIPQKQAGRLVWTLYGICVLFILFLHGYFYKVILHPFEKLENYAGEIAKGNLSIELKYERNNMFGAFTWAFDHMRSEITKARICEAEAIENNKTVTATLSHDIKTPIASIRAYSEGLEANMDISPERRQRYLSVIMKKCDEVTELTNDLFLHSLSNLDRLKVNIVPIDMKRLLLNFVKDVSDEKQDIVILGVIEEVTVNADEKRLGQVLENIISNSRKYAQGSKIELWMEKKDKYCEVHIKDGGAGIQLEDMPFLFEKFYRGKNIGRQPGAGLGLYIVKYIMKQMGGQVELVNQTKGLEVILQFMMVNSLF